MIRAATPRRMLLKEVRRLLIKEISHNRRKQERYRGRVTDSRYSPVYYEGKILGLQFALRHIDQQLKWHD
jgi:hypothetical protein